MPEHNDLRERIDALLGLWTGNEGYAERAAGLLAEASQKLADAAAIPTVYLNVSNTGKGAPTGTWSGDKPPDSVHALGDPDAVRGLMVAIQSGRDAIGRAERAEVERDEVELQWDAEAAKRKAAEAERDHWKANHDEQVAKKNRLSNKYTLALTNLNAWEQVGWHAGRHFMRYWPGDDGPLRLGWEPVYRRVETQNETTQGEPL